MLGFGGDIFLFFVEIGVCVNLYFFYFLVVSF